MLNNSEAAQTATRQHLHSKHVALIECLTAFPASMFMTVSPNTSGTAPQTTPKGVITPYHFQTQAQALSFSVQTQN